MTGRSHGCWINTVSRDHVLAGVAGGFTQAGHGSDRGLRRLHRGDLVAFYSPRTSYPEGARLQRFTAIGVVANDEPHPHELPEGRRHWRRAVRFLDASEVPAHPLVTTLSFVPDPTRWGLPFRRGLFAVPAADFRIIAEAMGVSEEF